MKKLACLLLSIILMFGLCACEKDMVEDVLTSFSSLHAKLNAGENDSTSTAETSTGTKASDTTKSTTTTRWSLTTKTTIETETTGTAAPRKVTVPDLAGKTEKEVRDIFCDVPLIVKITEAFSDTHAKGVVIQQSPAAGSTMTEWEIVTATISKGPEIKVTVPDVTGKPSAEAERLLNQAGLHMKSVIKCSDTVPEGTVLSQTVAAGTQLSEDSYVDVLVSAGVANTVGNTPSNSQHFGLVAEQGDWIYYSNMNDDYHLYKMRHDGSQKQIVTKGVVLSINVVGEWIYYTDEDSTNKGLFKVKLDGTEKTKLSSGVYYWVHVVGDTIYYSPSAVSGKLYCMKTDGTNSRTICSDSCRSANVVGDWIYYVNTATNIPYKIRTDGTDRTQIHPHFTNVGEMVYDNGLLLSESSSGFKCIHIDGTGLWRHEDYNKQINFLNANNGWLYVVEHTFNGDAAPLNAFYRISPDYEIKEKIMDINFKNSPNYYINVVGDWLYFPNDDDHRYMYRVKVDGTELEKVYQ